MDPLISLTELMREAKLVLAEMLNSGVTKEVVTPLLNKARKAMWANVTEEVREIKVKKKKRCKWWNRG